MCHSWRALMITSATARHAICEWCRWAMVAMGGCSRCVVTFERRRPCYPILISVLCVCGEGGAAILPLLLSSALAVLCGFSPPSVRFSPTVTE